MARIFISHSSANNDAALRMRDWLEENGWYDVFLDLDPSRGIRAGEIWQSALIAAADRCEAILCLVTPEWVASKWCWSEYVVAKKLGKRCFPVVVEPLDWETLPVELRAEHQIVDVTSDATGWTRLRLGIEAAGIAASGFAVAPHQQPYPGLQALTEADAALFFGRDTEILTALDELRRIAATPARRLLVILGASGAGKSSLLRAGLWPRLARDDRNFLPLPTIRPGRAALTGPLGLWASIEGVAGQERLQSHLPGDFPRTRGAIRAAVSRDARGCQYLLEMLAQAAGEAVLLEDARRPTLVLPIDQGEELFNADGRDEAKDFLTLLGELLAVPDGPIALLAMRTEVYPLLQAERRIAPGLHQPFSLAPMSSDRFRAVLEGPAARLGVSLEPALTDALVRDAAGADALPLLAFTIERLHREFGAAGHLRLADYAAMGGVQGALEAAVDAAFYAAPEQGLPRHREVLERLTRRAFLPHLVRINEAGEFARRTALLNALPEDVHALVRLLAEHRLLVLDYDATQQLHTVEIAHEALLRAWPLLVAWLDEERDFLSWCEEIARARARWANGQRDLLSGRELAIALNWQTERGPDIAERQLAFIAESEQRATAAAAREQRRQAWLTWLAVAAALIFAVFGGLSLWQRFAAVAARDAAVAAQHEAQRQAALARARELAVHAETVLDQRAGTTTLAGLLAVESLRSAHTAAGYRAWNRVMALTPRVSTVVPTPWPWSHMIASPDQRFLAFYRYRGDGGYQTPAAGAAVLLDAADAAPPRMLPHDGWVEPVFHPNGRWLAVAGFSRKLQVINVATGAVAAEGNYDDMIVARFAPTGQRLFVARTDGVVEIRQGPAWQVVQHLTFPVAEQRPQVIALTVSPDGSRIAVSTRAPQAYVIPVDGTEVVALSSHTKGIQEVRFDATAERLISRAWDATVRLWEARSGKPLLQLAHPATVTALASSTDGAVIATATKSGAVLLWDAASGKQRLALSHDAYVHALAFSPTGAILVSAGDDTAILWDLSTGKRLQRLRHAAAVWSVALSADGQTLVTGSKDGLVRFFAMPSGQQLRSVPLHGGVLSLDLHPITQTLAAGIALSKHEQAWTDVRIVERATQQQVAAFSHNGWFQEALFSPDGSILATTTIKTMATGCIKIGSTADGSTLATTTIKTVAIKLWDVASGTLRRTLPAQASNLFYTADGTRLISNPRYGEAWVFDAATGDPIASIGEPQHFPQTTSVDDVVVAAAAPRAVTLKDASLRVWETHAGTEVAHHVSADPVKTLAISPSGRWVAYGTEPARQSRTGDSGAAVVLWEPASAQAPHVLPIAKARALLFDPTGKHLAVQLGNDTVGLWELDSRHNIATLPALPNSAVRAITFSLDGRRLLVQEYGKTSQRLSLRVWNFASQQEVVRVDFGGYMLQVPGSDSLMTRDHQGVWYAWSPSHTEAPTWPVQSVRWLAPEPVSKQLVYGDEHGGASLLDVDSGTQHDLVQPATHTRAGAMAVARGVRYVAIGGGGSADAAAPQTVVYDSTTSRPLTHLPHQGEIANLLFVNDDEAVITATTSSQMLRASQLRLWRWRSDAVQTLITENPINAVTASPDGSLFATGEGAVNGETEPAADLGVFQARLWDARSGAERLRLPYTTPVFAVAFSPDGRLLATRSTFEIAIFQVADGARMASFKMAYGLQGGQVAFASGGHHVLANVGDANRGKGVEQGVHVWSIDGSASHLLRHERDWPEFTVSGDGAYVATRQGKNVRVWDIAAGAELANVTLAETPYNFAFAGKHEKLIVNTGNRLVQVLWRTAELIKEACQRFVRPMTEEEWQRFFNTVPYRPACADNVLHLLQRGANEEWRDHTPGKLKSRTMTP